MNTQPHPSQRKHLEPLGFEPWEEPGVPEFFHWAGHGIAFTLHIKNEITAKDAAAMIVNAARTTEREKLQKDIRQAFGFAS